MHDGGDHRHPDMRRPSAQDIEHVANRCARRRSNDRHAKRNLIVFVTPYIIKDSNDVERLTQYKSEEVTKANADVIFERGFIKKIKNKHYVRNRYRPGQEKIDSVRSGAGGFERGDVER